MAKSCKQCGEEKPNERFRKYYGGRKGRYNTCMDCEKLNSREKYLVSKGDKRTAEEDTELDRLHELYDIQRKIGLQPPRETSGSRVPARALDDLIAKYSERAKAIDAVATKTDSSDVATTDELTDWLVNALTDHPDHYIDTVYEQLKQKYRPVLYVDDATALPVYDETYRSMLDTILERFYAYEDEYNEEA